MNKNGLPIEINSTTKVEELHSMHIKAIALANNHRPDLENYRPVRIDSRTILFLKKNLSEDKCNYIIREYIENKKLYK